MDTRGRRRGCWWCSFLLVLCASAVPSAQYRTVEVESLRMTVDSDWVPRAAPGYLPLRFDFTNLGDGREIEIRVQGTRFFRPPSAGSAQGSVRQTVRLEAGDRLRLTIPVPVFADNETHRIEILEDNRVLERFTFAGLQSRSPAAYASAVIVADTANPAGLGAIAGMIARPSSRGGGGSTSGITYRSVAGAGVTAVLTPPAGGARMPTMDLLLEPARLPATWLAFTSVRAVVIGRDEWALLNDGQKNALLTWTAAGGSLIFVDGTLDALIPGASADPSANPDRIVRHHLFGQIHVLTSEALGTAGLSAALSSIEADGNPLWTLPANTTPDWGAREGRGFRLTIPGVNGVPARTFLAILVVFSGLIGPVSYWFLRRRGQLVLLVLTAPLISLISIGLLVGYALADEGFVVQGRAVTFTLLDQASRQSVTRATVSLYAPGLSPTPGLHFPRDVAVFPIGAEDGGVRERMTLDLTDTQAFTQGLLETRSPTNFEQVSVRAARERLTFSRNGGGLTVTNGLDAPIAVLRYRDGDSWYALDSPLPPGGQQTLKAIGATTSVLAGLAPLPAKFLPLFERQAAGSYLALLDRSPFWEPGAANIREVGSVHVVLGWPERRP